MYHQLSICEVILTLLQRDRPSDVAVDSQKVRLYATIIV